MRISTSEIDRVVAVGLPALPNLFEVMQTPGISFDTFARCYSAANEILKLHGSTDGVGWGGGYTLVPTSNGLARVEPGGQLDVEQFKMHIVAEFRQKTPKLK
jgi:hypothetical protein